MPRLIFLGDSVGMEQGKSLLLSLSDAGLRAGYSTSTVGYSSIYSSPLQP